MTYGEHCTECPLKGKGDIIEGRGGREARFMVVTDVPNHRPEAYGRIMPQSAMTMFGKRMAAERFDKEDFWFQPQVRCPYDPDQYTTKEKSKIQKCCRPYLQEAIKERRPEVIIPLGVEPSKQVFGRAVKITKVRGIPDRHEDYPKTVILPMLNPIMVVIYPQHEAVFKADCATLGRLVDGDYNVEESSRAVLGEYEFIDDLQFLIDANPRVVGYDTENTGLRWFAPDAQILTMQFSIEPGKAYMLPWGHPDRPQSARAKKRLTRQLRELLCDPDRIVVGQNAKYDAVYTYAQTGVRYRIGSDTLVLAALLDENTYAKNLDELVKRYVPDMAGYADKFNATVDKSRMIELPLDQNFLDYGCGDADAVIRLHDALMPELEKDAKLLAHYNHITIPGLNAFASVELRGLNIDEDVVETFEAFMEERVGEMKKSLLSQVPKSIKRKHVDKGLEFSRASFLLDILFYHEDGFCLKPKVYTKTTAKLDKERRVPSTSTKDHLPYFYETCPFTFELSEYVKSARILGTNVKGFKKKYIVDKMVRPTYNMHIAVTGRTSCVRGDTPVDTLRGVVRADAIAVGDMVFTHRARWMPVRALFRKDPALMYGLHLSNGEVLTVTAHHRVMLESGAWADVGYILQGLGYAIGMQKADERSSIGTQGSHDLQDGASNCGGGGGEVWGQPCNGAGDDPRAYTGRGIQYSEGHEVPRIQTGGEKPAVRETLGFRLRGWTRLPDEVGGRQEVLRPSHSNGGVPRAASLPATGVSEHPPRRREYKEQLDTQSVPLDAGGTPSDTRPVPDTGGGLTIEKVVCAGVHRVYDFEVEEDHSYTACGVVNHNSEDPNGQNFPKRGPIAMAYRKLFVAPPGYVLLEADLSQAELRIAGDMANDPTMLRIYRDKGDIHTATALIVLSTTMEKFRTLSKKEQKDARTKAKSVNFGFLYGMGWRKFVAFAKTQYGVEFTEKEAQRIRAGFFSTYFKLPEWHATMREYARKHKMVRSYSGRIRHLPMIDSPDEGTQSEAERQAINSPVQEFGSSLGVMACGRMNEEVDPQYLSLVGFVHDAIYAYVPKQYVEWGAKTLKWYMESNPLEEWFGRRMKLPIVADVGFGLNLSEVHEMGEFETEEEPEVGTYDFEKLWEGNEEARLPLPRQRVPPNNGRLVHGLYDLV